MEATITAGPAPRRHRGRKALAAFLVGALWLGIAGTSFAFFMRTATGTIHVQTTGPGSVSLELLGTVAPFTDTGQSRNVELLIRNTLPGLQAGEPDTYTMYRVNSAAVQQGTPCAGYFSFTGPPAALAGGSGVTFRNIANGNNKPLVLNSGPAYNGTNGTTTGDVRTARMTDPNSGQQFILTLAANAPQACANQADVALDVSLELIP